MSTDGEPHICIYKWDELQHYKNRNPPWIKLYNRLLDHYEFGRLPDRVKAHYLGLLMLRSRHGERLPLDVDWMASRINATDPLDLRPLISAGLIQVYHADSVALYQDDSNPQAFARSREAETEAETESTEGSSLRSSPSGPEPAVENPPWNERLAPLVRDVAFNGRGPPEGQTVGRSLSKAKQLIDGGYDVDDLEDAIRGLRQMAEDRHRAVGEWLGPDDRFTVLAFGRAEEKGQKLVQRAAHYWRKNGDHADIELEASA